MLSVKEGDFHRWNDRQICARGTAPAVIMKRPMRSGAAYAKSVSIIRIANLVDVCLVRRLADLRTSHLCDRVLPEQVSAAQIFQKCDIIIHTGNTSGSAAFIFRADLEPLNFRPAENILFFFGIEPVLRGDLRKFIFRKRKPKSFRKNWKIMEA